MNDMQISLQSAIAGSFSKESNIEEVLIDQRIDMFKVLPMYSDLSEEDIEEVRRDLKSKYSIILDKGVLIQEKGHEKWFLSRKASLDMRYWERYRQYLLFDKGFSSNVVNTMDDMLDTLTDLLGDPTRDVKYNRRGLIIGDVQSGKTANYTGLICKAVDSGYKVIVLMTGTIEKLRQQTQQRIDEGFVGSDSKAMMKNKEDNLVIGVGKYDASIRPMVLTSTIDDFKSQNANNLGFDLSNINGPVMFVVKKNSAVLGRLNKWLSKYNQDGQNQINHSLLVIDDEADNASVNTKANPEDSPTAINGHIRKLLHMFKKSSYVGFTATPFANIFIDPETDNAMFSDDLFPKDFIYSLNAPSNYIGARNIFNENGDAKKMLVEINDDVDNPTSIASILPLSHKQTLVLSKLPSDLETSITAFMLANAIEDLKGLTGNHRSMLVNVSRFTNIQGQIAALINEYLKDMQSACRNYASLPSEKALKSPHIAKLRDTYEKLYSELDYDWEEIQSQLHMSCASIIVQLFNQKDGKNFSYDEYKNGLRVIAVGGMSLSRGLTLEGLVISYFYRNSKMYDTLMQMGRWFGYRSGYEELCRIFMSNESIDWYRYISQATDELREEVKRYEDTSLTPMDFGLRVRSDITSLLVTARNKMRSAESRDYVTSLSGEVIETPEIYSDLEKNSENKNRIVEFVDALESKNYKHLKIEMRNNKSRFEFRNIPAKEITNFMSELDISPKNIKFNVSALIKFVNGYKGNELDVWDVAFVSGESSKEIDLGHGIQFSYPKRLFSIENDGKILRINGNKNRLGAAGDGKYCLSEQQIRQLENSSNMSALSQRECFKKIKRNPLLIIYFVELNMRENEKNLDIIELVDSRKGVPHVGFGVGIPILSNYETKYVKYVLNKVALQQIFDDGYDDFDEESDD